MREKKILRKKITRCFHQASTFDGIFAAWLPFFKHMLYHLNIYIKRLPGKEKRMREHALLSLFNNTLNVIIMKSNGIQKNKSELKWKFFKISFICHTIFRWEWCGGAWKKWEILEIYYKRWNRTIKKTTILITWTHWKSQRNLWHFKIL